MSYRAAGTIKLSKADKDFSLQVRTERDFTCEHCGKRDEHYVCCHHVEGRTNKRLRFERNNICLLCPSCHTFNDDFSAHRTPKDFKAWFAQKFPERWNFIQEHRNEKWNEQYAIKQFYSLASTF